MELYWLYAIENKTDGKKYIGWTVNPQQRWKQHIKDAFNKSTKQYIHNAIRAYGPDNFWFRSIEYCFSQQDVLARERELIKFFQSNNSLFGYNLTEGGEGALGYKHTEETKVLLSTLAKQKIGELNPFFGKKHTPEVISLSVGENNKRAKLTQKEVIDMLNNYYSGNFVEQDLAKMFGITRQTVNDILRGKRWKHIPRDIEKIAQVKLANKVIGKK